MPPPSPLSRLARLRAIEQRTATLALADRLGALAAASAERDDAAQAIRAEAGGAPDQFARWIPRALAEAGRAQARLQAAETAAGSARAELAGSMRRREVVQSAMARHAAERVAEAGRRDQHALDEVAGRRK